MEQQPYYYCNGYTGAKPCKRRLSDGRLRRRIYDNLHLTNGLYYDDPGIGKSVACTDNRCDSDMFGINDTAYRCYNGRYLEQFCTFGSLNNPHRRICNGRECISNPVALRDNLYVANDLYHDDNGDGKSVTNCYNR